MNHLTSGADSGFQSAQVSIQADRIFEKLKQTFEQSTLDAIHHNPIDHALEALIMIYQLPDIISCFMGCKTFQMVVQSCVPKTCSQKKWEVSCLAIRSVHMDSHSLSGPKELETILTFLGHYFTLGFAGGKYQDEPIQNALYALASISNSTTIEAIRQFNPTGDWFVYGIRHALQSDRAPELRKAALLFLPLIVDIWFHPSTLIMGSTEMGSFCRDWASTVDSIEHTSTTLKAALTVLFGMINSSLWRPHIVPDEWTLLENFRLVQADLESLHLCINNPGLITEIRNVDNHKAMVLWAEILWSNYTKLTQEIRKQLVKITAEVSRNERGTYLSASGLYIDKYLSILDSELEETKEVQKVKILQQAHKDLTNMKQGMP